MNDDKNTKYAPSVSRRAALMKLGLTASAVYAAPALLTISDAASADEDSERSERRSERRRGRRRSKSRSKSRRRQTSNRWTREPRYQKERGRSERSKREYDFKDLVEVVTDAD